MSKQTEDHQNQLMSHFIMKATTKYKNGVVEHGEGLWNLTDDQLIEAAYEEVIDLVHYLTTLIQNRKTRDGTIA